MSLHRSILLSFCAVALAWPPANPAVAHEGHDHDGHTHEQGEKFFTTRGESRVLPLAKEEDVFHFVVYGDRTGGVPEGLKVLEQAVVDTNLLDPDLVMTVGDLIQGYNQTPEWMRQMSEYKEIMDRLKMQWFPVAGNHDVYWRGTGPAPQGQHDSNYEKHFGPLWYSFQHKNAGFVVLYSDEGDPETNTKSFSQGRLQTMSEQQLEFLRQALAKHKALDHVFVFLHHPRWIGGGYTGGNWDVVHETLKEAGNVSAVFAGHIHHIRFDGPKDGISYYTLATTGGHLSADIPGAGYLHHMNVVTVRPEQVTVAALPVGSVIDPTEFTEEFLAEIDRARSARPEQVDDELLLSVDGSAAGQVTLQITNPATAPIDLTASLDSSTFGWTSSLDHEHMTLAAGETKSIEFSLRRLADPETELSIPRVRLDMEYVGKSTRIALPPIVTPISMKLSAVPADYFQAETNLVLDVTGESSAVRIESDSLKIPDGPFTVEAWINPSQTAGQRGLIAKTQSSEYAIFMDEGVPQFDVHLNGRYVSAKARDVLPVGKWTHVAGQFDGSKLQMFVDGKLAGEVAGSGSRTPNDLPLYVGADPDTRAQPTRSFLGKIDEVRVSVGAVYGDEFTPQKRLSVSPETLMMLHLDRTLGPFVLDQSNSTIMGSMGKDGVLVPAQ